MSRFVLGAGAAAFALLGAAIIACADSNPAAESPDSAAPSPSSDAGEDAPVDARDAGIPPERICTDEGWCHSEVPPDQSLVDLWADGAGGAWAVSDQGSILRWDGASWRVDFTSPARLAAIWGSGPNDLWAGGKAGLFHGDGTSWVAASAGEDGVAIQDIGGGATDAWAVGRSGAGKARAFRRLNGGVWKRAAIEGIDEHEDLEYFTDIRSVWTPANHDVWMVAVVEKDEYRRDVLLRLHAAPGSRWNIIPPPATAEPGYESFRLPGGAVGDDIWLFGNILFSGSSYWTAPSSTVEDGTDWKSGRWRGDTEEDSLRRSAVWGLTRNDVWTCGEFGVIQHWDGSGWRTAQVSVDETPIGDALVALGGRSSDDLWAVGGRRALHHVSKAEAARLETEHAERMTAKKDGGR